jgi:hypothetical protein
MALKLILLLFSWLQIESYKLSPKIQIRPLGEFASSLKAERWDHFDGLKCTVLGKVPAAPTIYKHMGEEISSNSMNEIDRNRRADFNINMGKCMEVLRRELPYVFAISNLDFSIFGEAITIGDGNCNKMVMQKTLYAAAVKSLRIAASFSSIYPSMNVRKIEYIDDISTIQCLVEVVLPDSVRVDGQSVWEGMFYFGVNEAGLITSHIFDRKISNKRPNLLTASASKFPWLQAQSIWSADLVLNGCFKTDCLKSV